MAVDRDLAVAVVRALEPAPASGWEVAAATGIRGLRLLNEAGGFTSFVFTEASDRTFAVLQQNVGERPGATAVHGDGRRAPGDGPFDYVDVDPYGSPLPFLDAAFSACRPDGVLAVTATDMTVLAGAQASACRRRYGASPVRGRLGPEGALRILLMVLARQAAARARSLRPLLAYVGTHHVRAYVRLGEAGPHGLEVATIDPRAWDGPPLAGEAPLGPFWLGPLADPDLVGRLVVPPTSAMPRELGRLLDRFREEASVDRPFYYEGNSLAETLGLPEPPGLDALTVALRTRGYRAARTHARPEGFRTDAPRPIVEELAKASARRP